MQARLVSTARVLGWIALCVGGAVGGAAVSAAARLEPVEIVVPMSAALAVAVAFALRPAVGIGAFLLLTLTALTIQHWLDIDLRYFDEISVVLMVLLSAALNRSRIVRLRPGWKEVALGVAVGAGVVSSLASGVPADIWLPGLFLLVKGVAFFYAVSWLRLDVADVDRVGAVMLVVAGVILGLGFAEVLNPNAIQQALGLPLQQEIRFVIVDERGVTGISVAKSVFLHAALFGWFTAFVSLFLYARFLVLREWWALGAALILNVGTLLSARRRPVIGVLAALGGGAVWSWSQRTSWRAMLRTVAPVAVALLVLAVVTAPVLSGFYARTVEEYLGAGNLGEILSPDPDPVAIAGTHPRMALYVGSIAIARDFFPLGAGLGRFGSYMSEVNYSPLYDRYGLVRVYGLGPQNPLAITDTFWPMVLGELGPIGLAGMAAFLGLLLHRLWTVASRTSSQALRALALGSLFVFVEGLVGSLTAATYVAPPIAYFIFAAAGAVWAVARSEAHSLGGGSGDRAEARRPAS